MSKCDRLIDELITAMEAERRGKALHLVHSNNTPTAVVVAATGNEAVEVLRLLGLLKANVALEPAAEQGPSKAPGSPTGAADMDGDGS